MSVDDDGILSDEEVEKLLDEQRRLYIRIHSDNERLDAIRDRLHRSGEAKLKEAEHHER